MDKKEQRRVTESLARELVSKLKNRTLTPIQYNLKTMCEAYLDVYEELLSVTEKATKVVNDPIETDDTRKASKKSNTKKD